MEKVIKRNGSLVDFDGDKIFNAISAANKASTGEMSIKDMVEVQFAVCRDICSRYKDSVSVEDIQDSVENMLMKSGYTSVARAYVIYRAERAKIRNSITPLMDIYKKLTFHAATEEDIKRENANIDGDTAMGTMLKYGSEGSKYFINQFVLPKEVTKAHVEGDIHIHDQDFYMLTETCCQIDLLKLFRNGFSTGHGFLREPNSIGTASALACIAIQSNQNDMHTSNCAYA